MAASGGGYVALREGNPHIANASVDIRSDSDVQTPSRDVAMLRQLRDALAAIKSPILGKGSL